MVTWGPEPKLHLNNSVLLLLGTGKTQAVLQLHINTAQNISMHSQIGRSVHTKRFSNGYQLCVHLKLRVRPCLLSFSQDCPTINNSSLSFP